MDEYYQLLDLKKDATKSELKEAYYRLAKEYHPDNNDDAESVKRFQHINEAYTEFLKVFSKIGYKKETTVDQKVHTHFDPKYYEILHVTQNASRTEVKEAYKRLRTEYEAEGNYFKIAQIEQAYRALVGNDLDTDSW